MAKAFSPGATLTAAAAAVLAVVLAADVPAGPWQPAAIILGWSAVTLTAASLLTGYTWGLAAGAVIFVARAGIAGLAGDLRPGLAVRTALILAVIELGGASLEGRRVPLDVVAVAVRAVAIAAGGGLMVGLVGRGVAGTAVGGTGAHLIGLAVAFLAGSVILWLHHREDGA